MPLAATSFSILSIPFFPSLLLDCVHFVCTYIPHNENKREHSHNYTSSQGRVNFCHDHEESALRGHYSPYFLLFYYFILLFFFRLWINFSVYVCKCMTIWDTFFFVTRAAGDSDWSEKPINKEKPIFQKKKKKKKKNFNFFNFHFSKPKSQFFLYSLSGGEKKENKIPQRLKPPKKRVSLNLPPSPISLPQPHNL